jgi:N-acetylglucosamine-6-phosphate deacetylase
VQVEVTADRGVRRTSDDALSGSALTPIQCLRNAVHRFGRSLTEASILCSQTPARVLGLRAKGRLAAGMDADIIIVTEDFDVVTTICCGEVLYQA